jgi:hypothetical protein
VDISRYGEAVAEKLQGREYVARVNWKHGPPALIRGTGSHWWVHPTNPGLVDAAVTYFGIPQEVFATLDVTFLPIAMFAQKEHLVDEIGVGDSVFVTGLFTELQNTSRNLPIVRTGNIAMLTNEEIAFGDGSLDAYLIECRVDWRFEWVSGFCAWNRQPRRVRRQE